MKNKDISDPHQRLMDFLLCYRTTPHSTTNSAPCELFLQRTLRTRLDLLRPEPENTVFQKQAKQKKDHDCHTRQREFFIGQRVLTRNMRDGPRWLLGTIVERRGPLTYLVQVASGAIWKRHVDHLLESVDSPQEEHTTSVPEELPRPSSPPNLSTDALPSTVSANNAPTASTPVPEPEPVEVDYRPEPIQTPTHRYPQRQRRPPKRYQPSV